ncbi:thioesterase II family protein [Kibdelosporangium aridum]|uniref:thioesterase II family protein n=1 Tax=Kibdelosporangium aridum TaxID=2030 RepID=UPI000A901D91
MSSTRDTGLTETGSTAWLRRYHPGGTGSARLVCFPHAGGSASFFHPVSARFSPDADVIALQYPGRQDRRREPCLDDIATLADRITAELLPIRHRPTVLFGHSMGAVLAFEVAWRLERMAGFESCAVIASGRRAPSARRAESVHRLDDEGIIQELRQLNGTDAAVLGDDEILRMALPAIRGDYRAIETYECDTDRRLRCPITVLTGDTDPKTTLHEAQSWSLHTEGEFRLRSFPGGHFFLTQHQAEINLIIADELERLGAAG